MTPSHTASDILRIATYNIHKGVQGLGPARRLEIHNLGLAVEQLDADIVLLRNDLVIDTVLCRGQLMVERGTPVVRGPFEVHDTSDLES